MTYQAFPSMIVSPISVDAFVN